MLNISNNKLQKTINLRRFRAYQKAEKKKHYNYFNRFLFVFFILFVVAMFLPWTQNITGKGYVTTLNIDERPQTLQSPIPGRIEKWFVSEGDYINKGDTILRIAEIKSDYLDPLLVERTDFQRQSKSKSIQAYINKIEVLNSRIKALEKERTLKLRQAKNKYLQSQLGVTSDSINYVTTKVNLEIANTQFNRTLELNQEGLKSMVDLEKKRVKLQQMQAKLIEKQNKLLASQNKVINAELEISRIDTEYNNKINKSQSDLYSAQSSKYETEVQVSKLENKIANYSLRSKLLYITAPRNGFINKAIKTGIGETFKTGEKLLNIMPSDYRLAVETYIKPIDLPLVHKGEKVRIQFDGWPAFIFSGWPNASVGSYGGEVVAVERFISDNGKFRVLIAEDSEQQKWPENLRPGSGAKTIALLEDVFVWYEVWRQLNGFPANYYQPNKLKKDSKKDTKK